MKKNTNIFIFNSLYTYFNFENIEEKRLIALATGAIEERVISETKVYDEKELVDLALYEFEDTEKFIQLAEVYTISYVWGKYNLLILPFSFPFGGMENPTLAFVTPSLIAGDKSLTYVLAHEISHSCSGNLVVMDSWSDFWLNERFKIFIPSKKINRKIHWYWYLKQLSAWHSTKYGLKLEKLFDSPNLTISSAKEL